MAQDKQSVRAVNRALELLKCFLNKSKEMSLIELAECTNLPKTTVLRLMTSLEEEGFIEKDSIVHKYRLGIVLFQLGTIVANDLELKKISLPIMEDLALQTKETININIIQNDKRVCIEKVEGSYDLRQFVEIGKEFTLLKGASGKILFAYLPKEKQLELLEQEKEITDKEEFLARMDEIKNRGCYSSKDERVLGAAAISVPIKDVNGEVVAGLTISGASIRFTEEKSNKYIQLAKESADRISKSLGNKGSVK